jgi:hypothetical protein
MDKYSNMVYMYGGFNFHLMESKAIITQLDRMLMVFAGACTNLKDVEIYNGKKFNMNLF